MAEMVSKAEQAIAEGDLRTGLDPMAVGELIIATLLGAEVISYAATRGADLTQRLARNWTLLLPALTSEESLPYFREFHARESLRRSAT
jgi:hypothetical protein